MGSALASPPASSFTTGEIKTSLLDMESPQDLQYILRGLGYSYCIWNWCTQPGTDGSRGSGNFGIAVFSRVHLLNVRYGIGHPLIDQEGRTITAVVNGRPFIWVYAPSSRLTNDDPRNTVKLKYLAVLATHTTNVRRDIGIAPCLFGDFNIARHKADCSLKIDEGNWPSTYSKEREAFEHLLKSQDLEDAYANSHPALLDPKSPQGSLEKHISWWSTRGATPVGMRLDYLLVPRSQPTGSTELPHLRACEFATHTFGSDHQPLIASLGPGLPAGAPVLSQELTILTVKDAAPVLLPLRTFAPAPKAQALIEISDLDPTNSEIFKALNLITLPGAEDYRRLQASDTFPGTDHDYTSVLEFHPHDTHLNAIRTRLRDSTYSLNTISDTAAELPLAWIEMGQASTHLTRTLIDSGPIVLYPPLAPRTYPFASAKLRPTSHLLSFATAPMTRSWAHTSSTSTPPRSTSKKARFALLLPLARASIR
jgi:exodeoxyribonuclease-3